MGTDTAMPSGMLWMATATTMGMAMEGDWRAETKVANPSGKLWMAMARAVNTPMRISFRAGGAASSCSTSFTSWGFFSAGISLSIMAMNSMPPKKAATVAQLPGRCPSWAVRADWALAKISIMETYTMTPAEKPKLTDKNRRLVRLANRAIKLPMPVLNPAKRVKRNA